MAKENMNKTSEKEKAVKNQAAESEDKVTDNVEDEGVKDKKEKPQNKEEKKNKHKKDKKDQKTEELEAKLNDLSDKHLRLQAEFENFRRRTIKEKADLIKSGGEKVLSEILPVIDDFERAIHSMNEIPDDDAGKQGTLLIYSKFKDFLKQHNVKEIDALYQDFDVDYHEALTKIPAPDENLKGKVVDVVQKGYTLNDKVIRFAKVVVGE
ncbi:MAG: nucleotide exchange factor GrpE [Bacteroidota bacterium]